MSNQSIVKSGSKIRLIGPDWSFEGPYTGTVIDNDPSSGVFLIADADGDQYHAEPWEFELIESVDDPVNHPSHYTQYPVEVIQLTEHMPFLEGNVVKYVARAPFKGNKVQDLKKAAWYLDRAIQKAEAENE